MILLEMCAFRDWLSAKYGVTRPEIAIYSEPLATGPKGTLHGYNVYGENVLHIWADTPDPLQVLGHEFHHCLAHLRHDFFHYLGVLTETPNVGYPEGVEAEIDARSARDLDEYAHATVSS